MPDDSLLVLAGDCTTTFERGTDATERRGAVVVVVKPDDTVLVHDANGYRPAAWLTRAERVQCSREDDGFVLVATSDDRRLAVASHTEFGFARYPATPTGTPVGTCPDCGGTLVHADGVVCLGCDARYGLPRDATVVDETCTCGLPKMRVERGAEFELCVDRACESLDEAVRERFDREWTCPNCGGDLRILRRGGLIAGCERYPDCETGFSIPVGVVAGECDCGLPRFETGDGTRCLDATCDGS